MAQVDVAINGQNYRIACEEGQQDHLRQLAEDVDGRIVELVEAMGQIGELRLLVMVSMLMADELHESAETAGAGNGANGRDAAEAEAEAEMARGIDAAAQRIETIAAGIEQA